MPLSSTLQVTCRRSWFVAQKSRDHLIQWLSPWPTSSSRPVGSFWMPLYLCNTTTVPITPAITSCLPWSIRVLRLDWFLAGPSSAVAIHSRKKHNKHLLRVSSENLEMFLQLPRDQNRDRRESFWLPILARSFYHKASSLLYQDRLCGVP